MDTITTPAPASKSAVRSILVLIVIIALSVLAYMNYQQRVALEEQLSRISLQDGQVDNQQNVEAARRIVERVKKHYAIPDDVDPTVATIVDVETLRSRNEFYQSAKNGDHLVITPTRAILYDPDKDVVVDVVPVQLTPQQPAEAEPTAAQ